MMVTFVAKRVRNSASSIAESPPPTTTISFPEKKNPSQVAHEETPCPINCCSCGKPSHRADAPLAMISVCAWTCWCPKCRVNGRWLRSALVKCAMRYSAPNRSACLRMFSTSCGPMTPSGNPGKFSTSVVMESWPPGSWPSRTRGFRLARAVYSAAVCPEHPDPTITTFRVSLMKSFLLDGRVQISMRRHRHGQTGPKQAVGNSNRNSSLGRRGSLHFRSGCRLRFQGSIDFRQLPGHDAADSEQGSIVGQHLRCAMKQRLIRALVGRRAGFGGRATGQRHRRFPEPLQPHPVDWCVGGQHRLGAGHRRRAAFQRDLYQILRVAHVQHERLNHDLAVVAE